MSLDFKSQLGSAVDSSTGLVIYTPRMLPASPPESPDHTEYQYPLYLGGKRVYGLGLNGSDAVMEKVGRREWISKLDLGRDWVLDAVFEFKRMLGSGDGDFLFLQGLARGLVGVFEKDTNRGYDFRYLALTDAALLAQRGIAVPDDVARLPNGEVVLAEAFMPVHIDGVDAS